MKGRGWAIVTKEWSDVFRNKMVVMLVVLPAALMMVLGVGALAATRSFPPGDLDDMQPFLSRPQFAGLSEMAAGQVLIGQYFLTLFLLMPLIIPVSIAAHSIVGEKVQRSLEALLATPVSTTELLLGKCVAAVLPAVGSTWLAFVVFTIGARIFAVNDLAYSRLISGVWVLVVLLFAPLLSGLGVGLSVIMSSRVNDPRAVEQSIGMLVIPVLGLFIAQLTGLITVSYVSVLIGCLILLLLDALTLRAAVRLFDRETILTRWK
ncbi:MAG: ABC transporter permease subunit [Anaerolineae bacterium]